MIFAIILKLVDTVDIGNDSALSHRRPGSTPKRPVGCLEPTSPVHLHVTFKVKSRHLTFPKNDHDPPVLDQLI